MSLTAVQPTAPEAGHDEAGCLICSTTRAPTAAYRPHTLDEDCWCTRGADGRKISRSAMCWVFTTYLAWSPVPDKQEA